MKKTSGQILRWTLHAMILALVGLILLLLTGTFHPSLAERTVRVTILPFYTETGLDAGDKQLYALHYRRVSRFISNHLVLDGFEVINPFAKEGSEREYNRVMHRAREDSALASLEVCKKYGVDIAYILWLNTQKTRTADGYCKATLMLDGEGYDSAGRDLGTGMTKTLQWTRRGCLEAVAKAEKEIGDLVGRELTAWHGIQKGLARTSSKESHLPTSRNDQHKSPSVAAESHDGVLKRHAKALERILTVRLDGCSQYEAAEAFGKVINTTTGVVTARRYSSRIIPENPQSSFMIWRVEIKHTDPFRLQANVLKMVDDVLAADGYRRLRGVPYRYSAKDLDLLKGIRGGDATSREVQFVIDRDRVRAREFKARSGPQ
jgi:hypothetical protein